MHENGEQLGPGTPDVVDGRNDTTQEWNAEVRAQLLNLARPAPLRSPSGHQPQTLVSGILNPLKQPPQRHEPEEPIRTGDTERAFDARAYQADLRIADATDGWGGLLDVSPPSGPLMASPPESSGGNPAEGEEELDDDEILPAGPDAEPDLDVPNSGGILEPSEPHTAAMGPRANTNGANSTPVSKGNEVQAPLGLVPATEKRKWSLNQILNYGISLTTVGIMVLGIYAVTKSEKPLEERAAESPKKDPEQNPPPQEEPKAKQKIETPTPKQNQPEEVKETILSPHVLKGKIDNVNRLLKELKNEPESLVALNIELNELLKALSPFIEEKCEGDECKSLPSTALKEQKEAWKEERILSALTSLKTNLWQNKTLKEFRGANAEDKLNPEQKAIRKTEKNLRELINIINPQPKQ